MEKIIVTGANGFIGRYVVGKLMLEGYSIYAMDRSDNESHDSMVTHIKADLSKSENALNVAKDIGAADVLVHLAADITIPGDSRTIGNNISGMITAIDIAINTGVRHFVYLSSVPVIGEIVYTPIEERHPVHPRTPYHWSKLLGEWMLEEVCDLYETISMIRIPSPIGRGMRTNVFLPFMLQRMMCGNDVEIYGEGKRIQNYIDVRDIAEAILRVIKNKPQGLFLISGERSISNLELAKLCKQITHSSSRIVKGRHADPEESEQWILSCKKAAKGFGYAPVYDLETTIQWICEGSV